MRLANISLLLGLIVLGTFVLNGIFVGGHRNKVKSTASKKHIDGRLIPPATRPLDDRKPIDASNTMYTVTLRPEKEEDWHWNEDKENHHPPHSGHPQGQHHEPAMTPSSISRPHNGPGLGHHPQVCNCKSTGSHKVGTCYKIIDKATGSCTKRECAPKYVCHSKKTGMTCMLRVTSSKIVRTGYLKCEKRQVKGHMYVPYYA